MGREDQNSYHISKDSTQQNALTRRNWFISSKWSKKANTVQLQQMVKLDENRANGQNVRIQELVQFVKIVNLGEIVFWAVRCICDFAVFERLHN